VPDRSRIERYKPEALLGSAGLVDTVLAQAEGEAGKAVLRVFCLDRAERHIGEAAAKRFLDAGRRAQRLQVAGIASVLEVSDDPDAAFVATEFVEGWDLARLVQPANQGRPNSSHAVDPKRAAAICLDVARALAVAHAHEPPVHHLGLGPGNVVVSAQGATKVLDFGLAASLRGTPAYPIPKWHFVAPELLGMDAWAVGDEIARAADFYSLGALLYFLLTGQPPGAPLVNTSSLAELAARRRRPLDLPAGISNNLLAAALALTETDHRARPDSIQQVIDLLGRETGTTQRRPAPQAAHPAERPTTDTDKRPPASKRASNIPQAPKSPPPKPVESIPTAPGRPLRTNARTAGPKQWGRGSRASLAAVVLASALLVAVTTARRIHRPLASRKPPATPMKLVDRRGSGQAQAQASQPAATVPAANPELPPPGHGYVPDPDRAPSRESGHLFLDTSPSQADVWIDGVLRGKTPVDLVVGTGVHRMVAVKPGFLMWRAVYDTTRGEFARRELAPINPPTAGDALLDVRCSVADRYPVVLDDEETGLLCPVARLPVRSGKHSIGVFVPARRANVTIEVDVAPGRQPMRVQLGD